MNRTLSIIHAILIILAPASTDLLAMLEGDDLRIQALDRRFAQTKNGQAYLNRTNEFYQIFKLLRDEGILSFIEHEEELIVLYNQARTQFLMEDSKDTLKVFFHKVIDFLHKKCEEEFGTAINEVILDSVAMLQSLYGIAQSVDCIPDSAVHGDEPYLAHEWLEEWLKGFQELENEFEKEGIVEYLESIDKNKTLRDQGGEARKQFLRTGDKRLLEAFFLTIMDNMKTDLTQTLSENGGDKVWEYCRLLNVLCTLTQYHNFLSKDDVAPFRDTITFVEEQLMEIY